MTYRWVKGGLLSPWFAVWSLHSTNSLIMPGRNIYGSFISHMSYASYYSSAGGQETNKGSGQMWETGGRRRRPKGGGI